MTKIVYTSTVSYKNVGMGWEFLGVELELSLSSKLEVLTVRYTTNNTGNS